MNLHERLDEQTLRAARRVRMRQAVRILVPMWFVVGAAIEYATVKSGRGACFTLAQLSRTFLV